MVPFRFVGRRRWLVAMALLGSGAAGLVVGLSGCPSLSGFNEAIDAGTEGGLDAGGDVVPEDGSSDASQDAGSCARDTGSDPANCGSCARSCGGGACEAGVCRPVTLDFGQDASAVPQALAVSGAAIYWTTLSTFDAGGGSIRTCTIDDCAATKTTLAADQLDPIAIAANASDVYWLNYGGKDPDGGTKNGSLMRCPRSGCPSGPTVLSTNVYEGQSLAIDATFAYFGDNGRVLKCALPDCINQDGGVGGGEVVLSGGQDVTSLAVDSAYVYFTDYAGDQILKCQLPGCAKNPEIVANISTAFPTVAVDGDLFWTLATTPGDVVKCPLGACPNPTTLTTGQYAPTGIAVDSTDVYWTNAVTDGTVARCARSGCASPTVIATGQATPFGIALDAKFVYWTNSPYGVSGGIGAVMKIAK